MYGDHPPLWPQLPTARPERAPMPSSVITEFKLSAKPWEQDTAGSWKSPPRHLKRIFPLWAGQGFPVQTPQSSEKPGLSIHLKLTPLKRKTLLTIADSCLSCCFFSPHQYNHWLPQAPCHHPRKWGPAVAALRQLPPPLPSTKKFLRKVIGQRLF